MYLDELTLKDYRNYDVIKLKFGPHQNVVIGANAQGKTNILEAIYFLSQTRSHRRSPLKEMIRWDQPLFLIKAVIKNGQEERILEIGVDRENERRIKVNKVEKTRLSDLLGFLKAVMFSPEDLKIIKEGPEERRGYLNEVLSQLNPAYTHLYLHYLKVLRQRNALLREARSLGGEGLKTMPIWNEKLAQAGVKITLKRREVVERLNPLVRKVYQQISESGEGEHFQLRYLSQIVEEGDDHYDPERLESVFKRKLDERRELEIERGTSLVGPHRDDLMLTVDGIDLRIFGSQGEHRTAALALKLAELELLKEELKESPLLLLDDVMSELDESHREHLMLIIKERAQVIFTTTNLAYFSAKHLQEARLIEINNGKARILDDREY